MQLTARWCRGSACLLYTSILDGVVGIHGFEVLKAMNANHTIEDIPVIMISSEDSDAAIRRRGV